MPARLIEEYQVGWVCALPKEMTAARAMLDEEHEVCQIDHAQDNNSYVLGRVGEHNIVLACLPAGVYGTNAAATVANNILRTFTGVRFGLMVGIGGGVPNLEKEIDIRLGDVVVSQPDSTHGGVVQYDLGKNLGKGVFKRKGFLKSPPTLLLTALSNLQSKHDLDGSQMWEFFAEAIKRRPNLVKSGYGYPGPGKDILYCSHAEISPSDHTCAICEEGIVRRDDRDNQQPVVHYGVIASGNQLIKHSAERDQLGDEFGAKCVEMEAAGLMNEFPCIVIRGICDYADSHKNDAWQKYAALTAAAFAKELLSVVNPTAVDAAKNATVIMKDLLNEFIIEGRKQSKKDEVRYQTERERHCHQDFKTSPYEQYKNINPEKIPGTCHWVLDNELFQAWHRSTHHDLLWISADPGCGKSVLAKSLVDYNFGGTNLYSVCYFFFKDNERQDNLPTALCAILHQLFSYQPTLLVHALPAWEKNKDKIQQESEEMWRILLAAAADASARPIVCILDALDECRDEDRQELITKLCSFYERSTQVRFGTSLKFLVTSRPYDSVQRWFEKTTSRLPQIRLRGEDENERIHGEINLVIEQRVHDLAAEFHISEHTQETLRQRLKEMEHRTYLWLHLAQDEIRATYRDSLYPDEVQIEFLPSSVEDAYERILSKIQKTQKGNARQILSIIIGMRRPPTIGEMALALGASRAHTLDQSAIDRIDQERLEQQIRESCGLFVFINHSQLFLIHQTAKEFLVSQNSILDSEIGRWKSSLSQMEVESEMARLCVTYIYLRGQIGSRNDNKQPRDHQVSTRGLVGESQTSAAQETFFRYCAEHWMTHLGDETVKEDGKLLSKVLSLYKISNDQFHTWFPIMWKAFEPYEPTPEVQTQHVIAMSKHSFVLKEIFSKATFDLEARDGTGRTPLHWAAERGHSAVVNCLVQSGANVNAEGVGRHYASALAAASGGGHEQVVQVLLAAGADVNAKGGNHDSALAAASAGGHEQVVQVLLAAGADVNAEGGYYGSALAAASGGGHEQVVQVLLAAGADVNAKGGNHGSALAAASGGGHEQVVQVLLAAGADVNAEGGYYGSALGAASAGGHEQVVQVLLAAGADVNAKGGYDASALGAASAGGHEQVVQVLLAAGADVNAKEGGYHGSALGAASGGGHEQVVQVLLAAGADVNAKGGGYHASALGAASAGGHEQVVQVLLAAGADVNAKGGGYHASALAAASAGGHEQVVQVLLAAGADVNAKGGRYGSALGAASGGDHEQVVQVLLAAGADVNAEGGYDGSALAAASAGGHEQVVQVLLAAGADVNAKGGRYGSALGAASGGDHEQVVQVLLAAGADVNAKEGGYHGSALGAASAEGHEQVVQVLLAAGADVNAKGGRYGSALGAASAGGHEQVVQVLLAAGADSDAYEGVM